MTDENEEFKRPAEEVNSGETLVEACNAPAPLVVNGAQYVGCRQVKGHEGSHEVKINWPR